MPSIHTSHNQRQAKILRLERWVSKMLLRHSPNLRLHVLVNCFSYKKKQCKIIQFQATPEPMETTTLLHNEEESFALAPERKLIVDEVKAISGEEMKGQVSQNRLQRVMIMLCYSWVIPAILSLHWTSLLQPRYCGLFLNNFFFCSFSKILKWIDKRIGIN